MATCNCSLPEILFSECKPQNFIKVYKIVYPVLPEGEEPQNDARYKSPRTEYVSGQTEAAAVTKADLFISGFHVFKRKNHYTVNQISIL
jgi:hypothetical protein